MKRDSWALYSDGQHSKVRSTGECQQLTAYCVSSRLSLIQSLATTASELTGTHVAADAPLMAAGIDSIAATEFSMRIGKRLGTELP